MVTPNHLLIRTTCAQNGLELTDEQLRLLEEYAVRLIEWNKKINLISRRDEENFWTRHMLHCLGLLCKVEFAKGANVLDLGTGGGLPGIVLKIARPDLALTLIDSTQKKINVVKDLIDSLNLLGIDAVWGRAEDLGKQREYEEHYDVVVARAVAPLKDLLRWSYPFLKKGAAGGDASRSDVSSPSKKRVGGPALVAFKGGDLTDEIKQLQHHPNVGTVSTLELTLKGSTQLDDRDKKIVIVECTQSRKQNKP
jgi:16S rRNA (guanine(527)-N(7))-methyltransferase RsmG